MKLKLVVITTIVLGVTISISRSYADDAAHPDFNSVIDQAMDETKHADEPSPNQAPAQSKNVVEPQVIDPASIPNTQGLISSDAIKKAAAAKKKNQPVYDDSDSNVKIVEEHRMTKDTQLKQITPEESDYLNSLNKKNVVKEKPHKDGIYVPAPVEPQEERHEGFVMERDSSKIVTKRVSYMDSINVKVCFSSGLSIVMDSDIKTEMQTGLLDDKTYFGAKDFENHRGVYVHLIQPVPDGFYWESAVRIIRKDNDKTYLVNLTGVPCPHDSLDPYPKVIYLKDKLPSISGQNTKLMTPEDTIIQLSQGLPRKNNNKITVRDMIARSTSDWTIFSIQLQLPAGAEFNPKKLPVIKVLNNLQMDEVPVKVEFLPLQSEKETRLKNEELGTADVHIVRFKVLVNIDKQYLTESRFLYFMFVDKESGSYEYVKFDSLPYMVSLRERGFDF
jgi:hypothetical protein